MSTKKTEHYGLHAWEVGDDFLREEFNENFAKLDGEAARVVFGSYVGAYESAKQTVSRIELGFQPKAVFVIPSNGRLNATYGYYGGLALPSKPVAVGSHEVAAIVAAGFRVSHTVANYTNYSEYLTANENGKIYYYLAVK